MSSRIRSEFGTLAERSARARLHLVPDETELTDKRPADACHVFIDGTPPGLLVGWAKHPDSGSWFGRVAWAPEGEHFVAVDWLPASRITKA